MIMDNEPSKLVSPLGLRKAVNVFLIIIAACFIITSMVYFSAAQLLKIDSSASVSSLAPVFFSIAALELIEGIFLLVMGILGVNRKNDGERHKKLFLTTMIVLSITMAVGYLIDITIYFRAGYTTLGSLYVGCELFALVCACCFIMSYHYSNIGHESEKMMAIIASSSFLVLEVLEMTISFIQNTSSGTFNSSLIFADLFILATYIVFLLYYVKLYPCKEEPQQAIINGVPYGSNISSSSEIKDSQADVELLVKYKELLDKGILTQEEFDKKKSEILNKK